MTSQEFYAQYDGRVYRYALKFAAQWNMPKSLVPDLKNTCYTVIGRALIHWRPDGGKSAFNWCAPRMRRAMMDEIQRHCGNKPNWRCEPLCVTESIGEREFEAEQTYDIDMCLDVARAINADKKPVQARRFVLHALDPSSGEDIATAEKVTRQAINHSVKCMRKRMQKACQELKSGVA